jgi:hypothetical protein
MERFHCRHSQTGGRFERQHYPESIILVGLHFKHAGELERKLFAVQESAARHLTKSQDGFQWLWSL